MASTSNLLRCKVVLGSVGRLLHMTPVLEKPRIWPHLYWPPHINRQGRDFPPNYNTPKEAKRNKPISEPFMDDDLAYLRNVYPEFLPNWDISKRNRMYNRLERKDMLARRSIIDVPEFYTGSVLAVTVSDPNAAGKVSKFVGICILREDVGLRATFTLRNTIDKEGVEIKYDLYNPTIRSIEVLKLERWVDEDISYLRDASPEYSTFPMDMAPELRREGQEVPVFTGKIKLGPHPWTKKWWHPSYKAFTKNIEAFENIYHWPIKKALLCSDENEKYDLAREYRRNYPEEMQEEIWKEVQDHDKLLSSSRKRFRREQQIKR